MPCWHGPPGSLHPGGECRCAGCRRTEGGWLDAGKSRQLPATGCLVDFGQAFPKPRVRHPERGTWQKRGPAAAEGQQAWPAPIHPSVPRPSTAVNMAASTLLSRQPGSHHSRVAWSCPSLPEAPRPGFHSPSFPCSNPTPGVTSDLPALQAAHTNLILGDHLDPVPHPPQPTPEPVLPHSEATSTPPLVLFWPPTPTIPPRHTLRSSLRPYPILPCCPSIAPNFGLAPTPPTSPVCSHLLHLHIFLILLR